MRKRIFSFILALAMGFSLIACSNGTVKVNQKIQDGAKKLSSVENCCLVLQITINPKLEIYLNKEGTVLKVDAGNHDGKKLLEALELTGLSFADAMGVVLAAAAAQDFLAEDPKVEITVLASANGPLSLEQFQKLAQTVTDYSEALVPVMDQSIVEAENCGADLVQVEHMTNGDMFYSYFSNMERIREICYGADGSYHEWVYENRKGIATITIESDGARYEEHSSYEDGQMIFHSMLTPSMLEETTYYSNGTQKSHKTTFTDGSGEEQQFYENGNPKSTLTIHADGSLEEHQFHENGAEKYSRVVFSDGSVEEGYYDEAGNRIEP